MSDLEKHNSETSTGLGFPLHSDAPALAGTAHHKPAGQRRAPSITRHITLWVPENLEKDPSGKYLFSQPQEERNAWVLDIERFILGIYDKLEEGHPKIADTPPLTLTNMMEKNKGESRLGLLRHFYDPDPVKREGDPAPISGIFRHETVRINGIYESMPIEISVELHSEYCTISAAVDFGYRASPGVYDLDNETYAAVKKAITTLHEVTTNRYEMIGKSEHDTTWRTDRDAMRPVYATLYHNAEPKDDGEFDIWQRLQRDIFNPALERLDGANRLGRMIGDLRGLVLRRGVSENSFITTRHPSEEGGIQNTPSRQEIITGQPFGGEAATEKERMADIIRCADTLEPLMLADPQSRQQQTELSVSTLLGQSGLHFSAVSAQNPDPANPITPLPYLVLMTRGDTREMGRMIDTGQRLNTLRLAAPYAFNEMTAANTALHKVEGELNQLSQNLRDILKGEEGGEEVTRRLLDQTHELAKISQGVPGGIEFRGSRFAYYREQFRLYAEQQEFGAIPTAQAFPQMVRNRLRPVLDIIQHTQERFERINRVMAEIEEDVQTDQSVKAQERIKEIQADAEPFFFVAIAAIYGGELLEKVFGKEILDKGFGKDWGETGATSSASMIGLLWWKRREIKHLGNEAIKKTNKLSEQAWNKAGTPAWEKCGEFVLYANELTLRKLHSAKNKYRRGIEATKKKGWQVAEWNKQKAVFVGRATGNYFRQAVRVIRKRLQRDKGNDHS